MSHIKRSLYSSGIVLLCVGAVVAGGHRRTQIEGGAIPDVGQADTASYPDSNQVASKGQIAKITETDYFEAVKAVLKQTYVDPVSDDKKLVSGAIRGMVLSLNDPDSVYMDAKEFKAFANARVGVYEGIGAEMVFALEPSSRTAAAGGKTTDEALSDATLGIAIPKLKVAMVVPGGPADRAGVRPGDWVDDIDGKWVINSDPLRRLRDLQIQVQKGKADTTELNKLRADLRTKSRASILPGRGRDRLMLGLEGAVTVKWVRGGTTRTTRLEKGESRLPEAENGAMRLLFVPGAAQKLKQAVKGRRELVIDLRGNVQGDFKSMKECLAVLAPVGTYGYVTREQGAKSTPLKVAEGTGSRVKPTLLVDSTTQNAAEIFALALSSKGLAKLSGPAMANDRTVSEVVVLPDGSGFTLTVGKYVVSPPPVKKPSKVIHARLFGIDVSTLPTSETSMVCTNGRNRREDA